MKLKEVLLLPVRPLVWLLAKARVHPNILTGTGFLVTLAAAWLYATADLRWAALVLLAAGLFDTLDGQVARARNGATDFGALLDSSTDRLSEFAIFAALIWRFGQDPAGFAIMFLGLAGSVMISYTRARGEGLRVQVKTGPMPRAVRYFYIIVASLLPQAWFLWLMGLYVLLVWLTVVRRCVKLYTLLPASPAKAGEGKRRLYKDE